MRYIDSNGVRGISVTFDTDLRERFPTGLTQAEAFILSGGLLVGSLDPADPSAIWFAPGVSANNIPVIASVIAGGDPLVLMPNGDLVILGEYLSMIGVKYAQLRGPAERNYAMRVVRFRLRDGKWLSVCQSGKSFGTNVELPIPGVPDSARGFRFRNSVNGRRRVGDQESSLFEDVEAGSPPGTAISIVDMTFCTVNEPDITTTTVHIKRVVRYLDGDGNDIRVHPMTMDPIPIVGKSLGSIIDIRRDGDVSITITTGNSPSMSGDIRLVGNPAANVEVVGLAVSYPPTTVADWNKHAVRAFLIAISAWLNRIERLPYGIALQAAMVAIGPSSVTTPSKCILPGSARSAPNPPYSTCITYGNPNTDVGRLVLPSVAAAFGCIARNAVQLRKVVDALNHSFHPLTESIILALVRAITTSSDDSTIAPPLPTHVVDPSAIPFRGWWLASMLYAGARNPELFSALVELYILSGDRLLANLDAENQDTLANLARFNTEPAILDRIVAVF